MSKKNKNKFKKQIKAQLLQEITQTQTAQTSVVSPTAQTSQMPQPLANVTAGSSDATAAMTENHMFNLTQIKYDLKKTMIVVLILAGLIVVLYYLDLKYGTLSQFGSWLFKVLNIN